MVRTIHLTADVPPDRKVSIDLPPEVPVGPADIIVVVASHSTSFVRSVGDLAKSRYFGIWKDRDDLGDSSEFASLLRAHMWKRTP